MIGILLYLVIVGLIFAVLWWGLSQIPLPAPFGMVARTILVVAMVIVLVVLLARIGGVDIGSVPPALRL